MEIEEEGKLETAQCFEALNCVELEVISRSLEGRENTIHFEFPNFRVRSPSTGFPDLGRIEIEYTADLAVIDPSSLERYFASFRQVSAYGEDVVNRIFDDLNRASAPRSLTVRGHFVSDGDIELKIEANSADNPA